MKIVLLLLFVTSHLISHTIPYPTSGNLYETLGLKKSATPTEIQARYKLLAKKLHPDVTNIKNREEAKQRWLRLTEAYEILIDPGKRKSYDESPDGNEYEDDVEKRTFLRDNLFAREFVGGKELTESELDLIWKYKHPDRNVNYAVMFWHSKFPECIEASFVWRQFAKRLAGTSIQVAALKCDDYLTFCRKMNIEIVPMAFFFFEGQRTKYVGSFEVQQILEAIIPLIRIPKTVIRGGSLSPEKKKTSSSQSPAVFSFRSLFHRCPRPRPYSLEDARSTTVHYLKIGFVSYEYSPCYDCALEVQLMLAAFLQVYPSLPLPPLTKHSYKKEPKVPLRDRSLVIYNKIRCSGGDENDDDDDTNSNNHGDVCREYGEMSKYSGGNTAWRLGYVWLEGTRTSQITNLRTLWYPLQKKHSSVLYVEHFSQLLHGLNSTLYE